MDLTSLRKKIQKAITLQDQYIAQYAQAGYIPTKYLLKAAFNLLFTAQIVNPKKKI